MTEHVVKRPVHAEWPRDRSSIRIVIVGEAPGADEVLAQRPFVGASGRILNDLLKTTGIDRAECLVTNVFSNKPTSNEAARFLVKKREAAKIKKETDWVPVWGAKGSDGYCRPEREHDITRLHNEIREADPHIVIALGAFALWALTGLDKIGKHRGTVLTLDPEVFGFPYKLLATYHPAAVLRAYKLKPIAGMDLTKAKIHSATREHTPTEREIWIYPTLVDLLNFYADHIRPIRGTNQPLAWDIETLPDDGIITCIGFAPNNKVALVVPFYAENETGSYWSTPEEELWAMKTVINILEDPEITKLTQNGTYDITWVAKIFGIYIRGRIEDTMHLFHALQPELPKDLGTLGSVYEEESAWKNLARKSNKKDD